jgi:hypothetical protein
MPFVVGICTWLSVDVALSSIVMLPPLMPEGLTFYRSQSTGSRVFL